MATIQNPITEHREATRRLALNLKGGEIFKWLMLEGYFPESYVLPPCFKVVKYPHKRKLFHPLPPNPRSPFSPTRRECIRVHFPKSEYTDRTFGVMHPEIHNDIAVHISKNWKKIVKAMIPNDSIVSAYSFPVPIDSKNPGRIGQLRSGRAIYEFIGMIDDDLASVAYRYTHLVKADIKNFYPSIYTHSISWALHGKKRARKPQNLRNNRLLGNRLDKLFQNASDGCTNGIPIGPAVSDIAAELIAAAVDRLLSSAIKGQRLKCEVVRFKDDYRVLVKSESDGRKAIKFLQAALKEFNLELSDSKTSISTLPTGLFREWASMYHASNPRKKRNYSWKEFRELYLAVIRIDKACPGTGVIDRFLADIVSKKGRLKVKIHAPNLQKVLSMLLMLATLRVKTFPKVMAIIEAVIRSPFGKIHEAEIVKHLEEYLRALSADNGEERNKYLISWISYFLVTNKLKRRLSFKPKYKDPITRSAFNNRAAIFKDCKEHSLFMSSLATGKKVSMLEYLDVFNPPKGL
jgi:hypothetical protein